LNLELGRKEGKRQEGREEGRKEGREGRKGEYPCRMVMVSRSPVWLIFGDAAPISIIPSARSRMASR
jgi:hypothetical protein